MRVGISGMGSIVQGSPCLWKSVFPGYINLEYQPSTTIGQPGKQIPVCHSFVDGGNSANPGPATVIAIASAILVFFMPGWWKLIPAYTAAYGILSIHIGL